jgi:uncharacterized protein (DUF2062 family)
VNPPDRPERDQRSAQHEASALSRLRRWLPDAQYIRSNRWLRWLGPALHHPRLWHLSRRGLAMGMALGVFFGLLIPLAQIPLSVAAAVALRANVPAAVASTLVTNPLTFGPLYYAAWRLGSAILGEASPEPPEMGTVEEHEPADESWWHTARRRILGVGKPLLLGLAIMAAAVGLATYFVVSAAWRLAVLWKRRRRRR